MARGSAPLFVLLWAVLFLGEAADTDRGGRDRHRRDRGRAVSGELAGAGGLEATAAGVQIGRGEVGVVDGFAHFDLFVRSIKWACATSIRCLYLYLFLVVTWIALERAVAQFRSACGAA